MQNLNGTAKLNVSNGTLEGVDLDYLIDSAYSIATHKAPSISNAKQTRFSTLSGTAVIRNGIMTNQDLMLDTALLAVKGTGTVNLLNQSIHYTLSNSVKKHAEDEKDAYYNLYGLAIPVIINGNLSNPTIALDSNALVKFIAAQQLNRVKEKAKEKIQEKIQDQVSKQAADIVGNLLNKSIQ